MFDNIQGFWESWLFQTCRRPEHWERLRSIRTSLWSQEKRKEKKRKMHAELSLRISAHVIAKHEYPFKTPDAPGPGSGRAFEGEGWVLHRWKQIETDIPRLIMGKSRA